MKNLLTNFGFTLLICLFFQHIHSQIDPNQKKRADAGFEKGDYALVLQDYQQLRTQNAKSVEFNYKYATCIFHTDDIKKSRIYYDYLLRQSDFPPEVYYYRARIFQHEYAFQKAINHYKKYLELKPKKEQFADVNDAIIACEQAIKQIRQPTALKTIAKSIHPGTDFYMHYGFTERKYSFYTVDDAFEKINAKQNYKPVYAFIRGQKFRVFASYTDDNQGKDLFIQKKNAENNWDKPIRLGKEINTALDEDYAFFDDKEGILYFSSKGHNSIGGYDLYRAQFNIETLKAEAVENLGFPYSSPDDDLLYVPDFNSKLAFFGSNRNGNVAKVEVFTVEKNLTNKDYFFVKGEFSDLIDPKNSELELRFKNVSSNEQFGPVYTNSNGKIQIGIPAAGEYEYSVKITGSNETFVKNVFISKPKEGKEIQQQLIYEMVNNRENLTILTKEETEKFDDDALAEQLNFISKMDINAKSKTEDKTENNNLSQNNSNSKKTAELVDEMLELEIDLENEIRLQLAMRQDFNELEKALKETELALQSASSSEKEELLKNQSNDLKYMIIIMESVKQDEELARLQNLLVEIDNINKQLAGLQSEGKEEEISQVLLQQKAVLDEIKVVKQNNSFAQITKTQQQIGREVQIAENRAKQVEQELATSYQQLKELDASKEGKSKKQQEEIDLQITQKNRLIKMQKEDVANANFQLQQVKTRASAYQQSTEALTEWQRIGEQFNNESLKEKTNLNFDTKSVLNEKLGELNALNSQKTEKQNVLNQALENISNQTKEAEKIIEKETDVDKKLSAKIEAEKNRLQQLESLKKGEISETEKELLDEKIQESNARLNSLKTEQNQQQTQVAQNNTTQEKPSVQDKLKELETTHSEAQQTAQNQNKPEQRLASQIEAEEKLVQQLQTLKKGEISETEKELLDEKIQESNTRLNSLKTEQNQRQAQVAQNNTTQEKPSVQDKLKELETTHSEAQQTAQNQNKPEQRLASQIEAEENLVQQLQTLKKGEISESEKELLDEKIQESNARLNSLKTEQNQRQAQDAQNNTTQEKPNVQDKLKELETAHSKAQQTAQNQNKPEQRLTSQIEAEEKLVQQLQTLKKGEISETEKELLDEKIQESNARLNSIKTEQNQQQTQVAQNNTSNQTTTNTTTNNPEISKEKINEIPQEAWDNLPNRIAEREQQAQNKATENQARNSQIVLLKSNEEQTTDVLEKEKLSAKIKQLENEKEIAKLEEEQVERHKAILERFPDLNWEDEKALKQQQLQFQFKKVQLEESIRRSNNTQEKRVLENQIQAIDKELKLLEERIEKKKTTQLFTISNILAAPTSAKEIEALKKSPDYTKYLNLRNELVTLENEALTLEQQSGEIKTKLKSTFVGTNPTDFSDSQLNELAELRKLQQKAEVVQQKTIQRKAEIQAIPKYESYESMARDDIKPIKEIVEIIPEQVKVSAVSNPGNVFQIRQNTRIDNTAPLPVNPPAPGGLIYRVQVGAFRKPVPQDLFREFTPVSGDVLPNGLTCYMAGYFNSADNAIEARKEIRALGYADAFIVAYCEGKRYSFNEGKELERTGKCKPATDNELRIALGNVIMESVTAPSTTTNQTIPTTPKPVETVDLTYNQAPDARPSTAVESIEPLFFTVQIGVYNKPIKNGQLTAFDELYTSKSEKGQIRYATGKFNDVEMAKQRRIEAVQKGVADAFVVAYYKGKRITIAQANQLIAEKGNSIFEVESNLTEQVTVNQNTEGVKVRTEETTIEIKTPDKEVIKYRVFEKSVAPENAIEFLEKMNKVGVFVYNAEEGKVYSQRLTSSELAALPWEYYAEMNERAVKDTKWKSLKVSLDETIPGAFVDWFLRSSYQYRAGKDYVEFFPKNQEEEAEIRTAIINLRMKFE